MKLIRTFILLIIFYLNRITHLVKSENSIINFDLTNTKNNAYLFVEAGKIHVDAVAKIFKVDIELYYFDGTISDQENKFIASKKIFLYNQDPDTPKISMLYNLTHFSMFYTTETLNKHRQILRSPLTHLNNIIFFEDNVKCNHCSKEKNNKKVFFKKQNVTGCFKCIRNKTDVIIENRAMDLIGDNYMSRECIYFIFILF